MFTSFLLHIDLVLGEDKSKFQV